MMITVNHATKVLLRFRFPKGLTMPRCKSVLFLQAVMSRPFPFVKVPVLCVSVLSVILPFRLSSQEVHTPVPQPQKVLSVVPSDKNILMAADAGLKGALKVQWPDQAARFWVWNWTSDDESMTWKVKVSEAGNYSVALLTENCGQVLIDCKLPSPGPVKVEIISKLGKLTSTIEYRKASASNLWMRNELPGTLRLPAGESEITLRAVAPAGEAFNLALFSMELVKPAEAKVLSAEASTLRASTKWMVDAKYGLMFTWTAASFPRKGPKKTYEEATNDFDVNAFADMVANTGAGFIVFATSWSTYYFPAPIQSWERLAPGHTTHRDLIGELADALAKRHIKLMLYYHAGDSKDGWWTSTYVRSMDRGAYFKEWEDQIREIGLRYGDKLAGWWFDDGLTFYYPLQAPWKAMTEAAKAGYPGRVVGYNSWIMPKATDLQDYACGEGDFPDRLAAENDAELPVGGSGIFLSGPQKGLQATMTLTNEGGDWGHINKDSDVPPPRYTNAQAIDYIRQAISRKDVPVINLEVYQDGSPSQQTIDEFKAIKAAIFPAQ
jgi:hypothetical protein